MRFPSLIIALLPLTVTCSPTPHLRDHTLHARQRGLSGDAKREEWGPFLNRNVDLTGWMSHIPDDRNLAQMSIPGTHDTMTYGAKSGRFGLVITQTGDLDLQLRAGIRFLDIRIHYENAIFTIHHDASYVDKNLADVMNGVGAFLSAHPTETILMRFKHEGGGGSGGNEGVSFADRLKQYMTTDYSSAEVKGIFERYRFAADPGSRTWPTLGAARGKFIMLTDFADPEPGWGIPYGDDNEFMHIDDDYKVVSWDDKWGSINGHLDRSMTTRFEQDQRMYMTYTSGSLDKDKWYTIVWTSPYTVAMGQKLVTGDLIGMNTRVYGKLLEWQIGWRAGVVIMDFPGPGLIWRIIQLNPFRT